MNNEADVLRALQQLEQRLTAAFQAGIAEVQAALTSLQAEHNKALLEQERRNSTFADRERVEAVAARSHDYGNHALVLEGRIHRVERDVAACRQEIAANQSRAEDSTISGLKSNIGYIVTSAAVAGGTLLGFILNHLVR